MIVGARFGAITVPTLLMIGQKDTTAIPGAKLIQFPDYGHAPQMTPNLEMTFVHCTEICLLEIMPL